MKRIFALILALVCVLSLVGCNKGTDTMYQLGIMVDGVFYEQPDQPSPMEVDESAIIGYVESYTDTFPEKDGETNISKDMIGEPFAKSHCLLQPKSIVVMIYRPSFFRKK